MIKRFLAVVLTVAALVGTTANCFSQSLGQNESSIDILKWDDCGFISRFAPNKIKPECFQGLRNAVLDQDLSILRRNGYAKYNATACTGTQPIRGMWPFFATDGSQYLIFQSSASMFYSKGDGTCTAITGLSGGLSTSAQMSCVQALGQLWCSDGVDTVFKTNATSTAAVASAPLGKYIGTFRNRIVISGVSSNLTSVYLSGELDGTDWTLPAVSLSTSPAILKINGVNDGLGVKCLLGEFQNGYYIGRDYDLWQLSGYDLRDFTLRKFDSQIGCMDNNSPQLVNNQLDWLSHRGVEGLTGTQIQWLSYPIDPTLQTIIRAAGNSQTQQFTTQADWQSGNLTASGPGAPISATISPGDIVPSSASKTESSFSGTFSSAAIVNGSIQISTGAPFLNSGFEQGNFLNWTNSNWSTSTIGSILGCDRTYSICTGSCSTGNSAIGVRGNAPITVQVFKSGGGVLFSSTTYATNSQSCTTTPINVNVSSQSAPNGIYLKVFSTNYSTYTIQSSTFPNWTNGFDYGVSANCVSGAGGACVGVFDIKELSSGVGFSSATFNSTSIFDTGLSTPIVSGARSTMTASMNGSTVTFSFTYSDTSGGTYAASPPKEFVKYSVTFNQSNSTQVVVLSTTVLSAETTGYWISPCITAAGNTSWGALAVNAVTGGGSFTFSMSTSGVSCAQVIDPINANWTAVTPNSIIPITVSSYTAVRALFSLDVATQVPTINDITVNWNAGASRPPVASASYLNKYWLFYTTSQAVGASNDHAVVYDLNGHWQLMDDINAASSAIYLNSLYLGDSNATGTVYLFDSGSADNGGNFTFEFQTPDLDGGDPISPKQFSRAYIILQAPSPTTQTSSLSCNYTLDGSTDTFSLGTVNLSEAGSQAGYFVAKMPFPAGSPNTGHWVNLDCSNVGANGPIRIYGIKLVYTPIAWP